MRSIVFMQGPVGSGKSTFIKEHGLEPYTLCPNNIRMMMSSLQMNEEGMCISEKKDRQVFSLLLELLDNRMQDGAFTVVDATNCSKNSLDRYRELVKKHSYRAYVVKFDVPFDTLVERNKSRGYHKVPEEVIVRMYNDLQKYDYKKWYKVISPDEYESEIHQRFINLDEYENVVHIGDIHGCYSALKNLEYSDKNYYVFMGDYFDRGLENGETAKFLLKWMEYPNVTFLYGNHERHIENYLKHQVVRTIDFARSIKEIHDIGITNEELHKFCKKLQYIFCYEYNNKKVICTHAGLPFEPEEIRYIDNRQFYNGIGGYGLDVDNVFIPNTPNLIQIHGHRNNLNLPYNAGPYSYNLNTSIEGGAPLRVLFFSHKNVWCEEYENPNPNPEHNPKTGKFYFLMRDKDIVKKEFGDVVSFNFSRETFWEKRWTENTILARGLFCDNNTKQVCARGYEKFFEIGENNITSQENIKSLQYPLEVYRKENGYLGILGVHNNKLLFCSKSSTESDFAIWFKEIFSKTVNKQDEILKYLIDNNACMVFEVIDPINDTHIINYGTERKIVLLDVLNRDFDFNRIAYKELVSVAEKFGLEVKAHTKTIVSFEELTEFINETSSYDYKENNQVVEGYVVEDSSQKVFHFKIKTGYYKFWKIFRNTIERNQLDDKEKFCKNLAYAKLKTEIPRMFEQINKYKENPNLTIFDLQLKNTPCD